MITLLIVSIVLFTSYICTSIILFKVPESISETYYLYNDKYKNGWIFTIFMFIISFMTTPLLLELSNPMFEFVAFLCGGSILMVGAAPRFKSFEKNIHYIGAAVSAVFSIIYTFINIGWISSLILVSILSLVAIFVKKNRLFWMEMIAFINIFWILFMLI